MDRALALRMGKYNGAPDWGIWVELSEEVVASFHWYKTGWVIDLSIYGKGFLQPDQWKGRCWLATPIPICRIELLLHQPPTSSLPVPFIPCSIYRPTGR